MMFHLPFRMCAGILLGAAIVAINGGSYAGYPADDAAQKGGKHCIHGCCGHSSSAHKSCLHRLLPPMLPVLQSQAIRTVPAESDAVRMRLQVKAEEEERPREQSQEQERPGEQLRSNDGPPFQKDRVPTQKANYLSTSTDISEIDERFNRLERQMNLLLQRFDGLVEQQATRPQPLRQ